ncbi:hypothetical protein M2271_008504, partial [Streptomyces sp. LBL]|uniref:hypothetical protein n=1 Tax=Streptomyces sp. LBL TaxID=2940562 RepID=UPI0024747075
PKSPASDQYEHPDAHAHQPCDQQLQPAHLSMGTGIVHLWRLTPDGRTSSGATAATPDTAALQGIPAELSTPDAPSSKVVIRVSKQRATPLASAQAARAGDRTPQTPSGPE